MTWVSFALGVFCGVFAARLWNAVFGAWARVNSLRVEKVELRPADQGLPRAFIRGALEEFHVRQMAPRGYLAWFREDTGEPVSSDLERRLHVRLTLARAELAHSGTNGIPLAGAPLPAGPSAIADGA